MSKAKQDPDRMPGRDFRSQNDAKKAPKARLPEAKREGLDARTVLVKTRRAEKTADEAAEKRTVRQKRSKIQTAWQD